MQAVLTNDGSLVVSCRPPFSGFMWRISLKGGIVFCFSPPKRINFSFEYQNHQVGCQEECDKTDTFKCRTRSLCVSQDVMCDGKDDCCDGSDEDMCTQPAPPLALRPDLDVHPDLYLNQSDVLLK